MVERTIKEEAPRQDVFQPPEIEEEIQLPNLCDLCPPPEDGSSQAAISGSPTDQRRDAAYEEEQQQTACGDGGEEEEEGDSEPDGGDGEAPEAGGDGRKIEIGEDEFERYFPKMADELKKKGITKLTVEPTENGFKIGAELKEDLTIENPEFKEEPGREPKIPKRGDVKEMKFDQNISFEIEKSEDGTIRLSGIDGIHAKSWQLNKWRDTDLDSMSLKEQDGKTLISTRGYLGNIPGKGNPRTEDIEVLRNAERFFERLGEITTAQQPKNNQQGAVGAYHPHLPQLTIVV